MLIDILVFAFLLVATFIALMVLYKGIRKEIELKKLWEAEDYYAERKEGFDRIMSQIDLKSGK